MSNEMTADEIIDGGTVEELRELAKELAHENRRLRLILDTLAKAGVGTGALAEIYGGGGRLGFVVCRADRDEVAFMEDMRACVDHLAAVMGSRVESMKRTGVTR